MCNFLSWIEKGDKVYYLTHDLIHSTPRGDMIQKRFPGDGELIGHSAIRAYFEIDGGTDRECENFSSPSNFPAEIVAALKDGKFWGMGTPGGLLTKPALAEYEKVTQAAYAEYEKVTQAAEAEYQKVRQPALAEYEKVRQPAYAEYEKVMQPAYAEYEKVRQTAEAEYQKVRQPAYAEYEKVTQAAEAEYEKVRQTAYWDLFAIQGNRAEAWK